MSEKNEKPLLKSVSSPSQGWKQKLFGPAMTDESMQTNPAIAKSWAGRQIEFPDTAKNVMSIKPMSGLRKMLSGNAYGYTSPLGQISINNDQILADNQDINDVMTHEMAHAKQGVMGYVRNMFGIGNDEEKAINTEAFRKVRKGDIHLPNIRPKVK